MKFVWSRIVINLVITFLYFWVSSGVENIVTNWATVRFFRLTVLSGGTSHRCSPQNCAACYKETTIITDFFEEISWHLYKVKGRVSSCNWTLPKTDCSEQLVANTDLNVKRKGRVYCGREGVDIKTIGFVYA
jgi:hypothetical protein